MDLTLKHSDTIVPLLLHMPNSSAAPCFTAVETPYGYALSTWSHQCSKAVIFYNLPSHAQSSVTVNIGALSNALATAIGQAATAVRQYIQGTHVSILAGNENETTCFRLGNGTTSLRSGPGHVGPSSRLDPLPPGVFIYPPQYLYIPRGIYISRAVFINP